jgi:hypothetical protein
MLNVNPDTVYNSLSVNEPAFVRKYTPLPLQASYTDKSAIQNYASKPSAPSISLSQHPHSSNTNILNKITPSPSKSNPKKVNQIGKIMNHNPNVEEDLQKIKK